MEVIDELMPVMLGLRVPDAWGLEKKGVQLHLPGANEPLPKIWRKFLRTNQRTNHPKNDFAYKK